MGKQGWEDKGGQKIDPIVYLLVHEAGRLTVASKGNMSTSFYIHIYAKKGKNRLTTTSLLVF